MRSYAKVSDRLWTGRLGKQLLGDHPTQALAAYLLSCQHNNMTGLFHFPLAYAQVDLGMKPKQAEKSLRRLADLGFIRYDPENDRVWIVEQWRHELNADDIHPRDKRRTAAVEILRRHLVSPLVAYFAARYPVTAEPLGSPIEGASMGDALPEFDSGMPHRSQEQEQEQQQEQEREEARARGERFEAWWLEYPRKEAKAKARESWERADKAGKLPSLEAMLAKLSLQRRSSQWTEGAGQFIPHPTTYLNQERWSDELKIDAVAPPKPRAVRFDEKGNPIAA